VQNSHAKLTVTQSFTFKFKFFFFFPANMNVSTYSLNFPSDTLTPLCDASSSKSRKASLLFLLARVKYKTIVQKHSKLLFPLCQCRYYCFSGVYSNKDSLSPVGLLLATSTYSQDTVNHTYILQGTSISQDYIPSHSRVPGARSTTICF
jgi:hypothetical protein